MLNASHRRAHGARAAALVLGCARAAAAQNRSPEEASRCAVDVVEVVPLPGAWHDAAAKARADLGKLARDECVQGTLALEPLASGMLVRIRTSDGREATRFVTRPATLPAVAVGLAVAWPAPATKHEAPVAQQPAPAITKAQSARAITKPRAEAPQPAQPPPTQFGLHASLTGGARVAFPTSIVMPDFEGAASVGAGDWIVCGVFRFAPVARAFDQSFGGYAYSEIALGLGGGRRFRLGRSTLELVASAEMVLMTEDGDAPIEEGGAPAELRIALAAHYVFPWGKRVRPMLSVDGEIAPTSLAAPIRVGPDLPPLPTWTLGLHAGVQGELL